MRQSAFRFALPASCWRQENPESRSVLACTTHCSAASAMPRVASRGLLRRALSRPVGSGRALATDAGVLPAAGRKYSHPAPLNAKKARGLDILNDPLWNKGTAFSVPERDRLGLKGLLPPVIKTIEEQRDGFLRKMRELKDPVDQVGGVRVRVS